MIQIKTVLLVFFIALVSCKKSIDTLSLNSSQAITVAAPDHIILVWFENKGYNKIIGNAAAPYINSLVSKGTLYTNFYALTHPSYPNYIGFFSGSKQGITNDACISGKPFSYPTIWSSLSGVKKRFAWYSESIPYSGYAGCSSYPYVEKHNPVTVFQNVPDSINKPLTAFNFSDTGKTNMSRLEQVVCITPNMYNDMHDGTINQGDYWLQTKFKKMVEWCRGHNSLFIVYWDESETTSDNRIPVIVVGGGVSANYKNASKYDHYNMTKTICSYYGGVNNWNGTLAGRSLIKIY